MGVINYRYDRFSAQLQTMPGGVQFPASLAGRISYNSNEQLLIFVGIMKEEEREILLRLSPSPLYQEAVQELYDRSNDGIPDPTVKIKVTKPSSEESKPGEELIAFIDCCSTETAIHKEVADHLGLPTVGKREICTGDGKIIANAYACHIDILGLERGVPAVIVGISEIEKNRAILGQNVLENFAFNFNGLDRILTITTPS